MTDFWHFLGMFRCVQRFGPLLLPRTCARCTTGGLRLCNEVGRHCSNMALVAAGEGLELLGSYVTETFGAEIGEWASSATRAIPYESWYNELRTANDIGEVVDTLGGIQDFSRDWIVDAGKGAVIPVGGAITEWALEKYFGGGSGKRASDWDPEDREPKKPRINPNRRLKTHVSMYAGRFKRKQKPRGSRASFRGATLSTEAGGIAVGSDLVCIGHTTFPVEKTLRQACRALVRTLAIKASWQFTSWDSFPPSAGSFAIVLSSFDSANDASAGESVTPVLSSANSYESCANELYLVLAQRLGTAAGGDQNVQFDQCNLIEVTAAGPPPSGVSLATIRMRSYKLHFHNKSCITLQNRTLSDGNDGQHTVNGQNDLTTDISANPLYGRSYLVKGNYVKFRDRAASESGFVPLIPSTTVGAFARGYGDSSGFNQTNDGVQGAVMQKIPPPSVFTNLKKVGKVVLNPGRVKKGVIRSTMTVTWNSLFAQAQNVFLRNFTNSNLRYQHKLGLTEMFCFEKMLNSRVQEPVIAIAWELNQYLSCYGTYSDAIPTAPIVQIDRTAYTGTFN